MERVTGIELALSAWEYLEGARGSFREDGSGLRECPCFLLSCRGLVHVGGMEPWLDHLTPRRMGRVSTQVNGMEPRRLDVTDQARGVT
jgi:hypothetical protein